MIRAERNRHGSRRSGETRSGDGLVLKLEPRGVASGLGAGTARKRGVSSDAKILA